MGRGDNDGTGAVSLRRKPDKYGRSPIDSLGEQIRTKLYGDGSDDLLKPEYLRYRNEHNITRPYSGHCYVASEVYFHLMGGKDAGYKAVGMEHENLKHWWIEHEDGRIIDLTAEQFATPVPYHLGTGRGFLTTAPCARSQKLLARLSLTNKQKRYLDGLYKKMAAEKKQAAANRKQKTAKQHRRQPVQA